MANSNIDNHEKEVLEYWKKDDTFEKSLEKTKGNDEYIFYDGPPFATGLPHYGHMLASIIKDVIPRFWTMQGKHVRRVWGWDCHGLPIENIAEQELGIKSKDEIEKMGIKKFNDFCRSKVLTYADEWKKVVDRIARWVDMDNAYKTMDNSYIESVWWVFKQLYEKGYIYQGEKILMYCPRCSTPLSKSEIAMDNSYQTVKDKSITLRFKIKNPSLDEEENVYALAWTTTPWTLPSNLALAVHPDIEYVYLQDKDDGSVYVLAKELISQYFKSEEEYEILKEVKGEELEGLEYEPLFPYFKDHKNAFRIIKGDFVSAEEGTGVVHIAPAFGEDDYNVCKENGIDLVQPIDEQGKFTEEVSDYKGRYIFDTNDDIIKRLKEEGKIVKVAKTEHEYPFCYRCDTPLIYRAVPSWFVDIQKIKPRLLELNEKINWYPNFLKNGRVKHNIESAPDWNISRNRYWATAMPVWKSESGKTKVIGSIEELKKYAVNLPADREIDLHKDYLDDVKLKDEEGEEYERIPEVLDCWFESGSMPFAQFHYPFENKEFFEKNFPSQFVAEYIGQTRAWFYYMMVLAGIIFDDIPFENVLTTGTILNKDGEKMSKSKKNYPEPTRILEDYGADSLRFYLLSSPVMNADNLNFSEREVEEVYKKVMLLLYNVNRFYDQYKEHDTEENETVSDNVMDKWILARLNQTIKGVEENMKNYNTVKATWKMRVFVDDLSTWYVRRSRERFNQGDKNAVATLRKVLTEFSKVIAPVIPFVSEIIYQTIYPGGGSVHLQDWPQYQEEGIDEKLLNSMERVRHVVSLGLRERDRSGIGIRWPLRKAVVSGEGFSEEMNEIVKSELNVKSLEFKGGEAGDTEATGISVELDTEMDEKLEAEGYAREISRKVQAFRKKLGLDKKDKVKTYVGVDEGFKNILEKQHDFIKQRTNSEELNITTAEEFEKENFKNVTNFVIKDKRGEVAIMTTK